MPFRKNMAEEREENANTQHAAVGAAITKCEAEDVAVVYVLGLL